MLLTHANRPEVGDVTMNTLVRGVGHDRARLRTVLGTVANKYVDGDGVLILVVYCLVTVVLSVRLSRP